MDNDLDFELTVQDVGRSRILAVVGEVDMGRGPDLKEELLRLAAEPGRVVVVDLSQVSFMDSTGLSALIVAERQCRSLGKDLRLVLGDSVVLKVLQATGLHEVLGLFATVDDAVSGQRRLSV